MSPMLEDKIAVVTGGAQGLGRAICLRLAQEGCNIVVGDLNEEAVKETAAEVEKTYPGKRAIPVKLDVTNEEQVSAMFDMAVSEFGRVDTVVANAGILIAGPTTEFDISKWQLVVNVNLVGYFITAKHAIRVMQQQEGGGSIVQINSKSGKKGSNKNSAYAASKFGGIGLTQSLALEVAEDNIRVNSVCPGNLLDSPLWVNSLYKQYSERWGITEEEVRQRYIDQVPMKRGATYTDVCNVVVFLASELAGYMTGQAINVTGGQEMH